MNLPDVLTNIHNVLVVCSDTGSRSEIENLMALSSNYHSTVISLEMAELYKPAIAPEVIVVDLHQLTPAQFRALEQLRARYVDVPLMLISEDLDEGHIRLLLKLRVTDWLKRPLNLKQLHYSLMNSLKSNRGTASHVHAVISAVGGAGGTTVAISMADILSRRLKKTGKQVALFDLDFSLGNCGYALNASSSYNLDTAVQMPSRVDSEFIDIIKNRFENRFNVYSFKRPELLYEPNGHELVLRMLDAVSLAHDHTILDIPYYYTPWREQVLSGVNSITLVSHLTLPAIKHTRDLALQVREAVIGKPNIRILFNRRENSLFGNPLKVKNVKEFFKSVQMVELSEDRKTLEEALNRGRVPSEINPRSKLVRQLEKHVDEFIMVEALVT
jgi:pilus assembly protein CpaE